VSEGGTVLPVASAASLITNVMIVLREGTAEQSTHKVTGVSGLNVTISPGLPTGPGALPSGSPVSPIYNDSVHLTQAGYRGVAYYMAHATDTLGREVFDLAPGDKISFIGNSWFQYAEDTPPDEFEAEFVDAFGLDPADIINAGLSGENSTGILTRFNNPPTNPRATRGVHPDSKYVIFNEPGGNAMAALTKFQQLENLAKIVRMCWDIGAIPVYTGTAPLSATVATAVEVLKGVFSDGYSMSAADAIVTLGEYGVADWFTTGNGAILSGSATLDFPSLPAVGDSEALTVTVTGAAVGDPVAVGPPSGFSHSNLVTQAKVTSANTVTITVQHNEPGGGPIDQGSGVWKVKVFK
jgi:hypothetical protein